MFKRVINMRRPRELLIAAFAAVILAGAGLGVWLSFGSGNSHASPAVPVTVQGKGDVASGPLDAMLAKASSLAGINVRIPGDLPTGSYIEDILVVPGPNGQPPIGGPAAMVAIRFPAGQYVLQELKGPLSGVKGATDVPALSAPGRTVSKVTTSTGASVFYVSGKTRSFALIVTTPSAFEQAKADFPKMIQSLSVD